jgi:amidase
MLDSGVSIYTIISRQLASRPSSCESNSMTDLHFQSATELASAILSKQVSSLELTQHFINRIESHDGEINAVVVRDFDRALDAARTADDQLAKNHVIGPLHGLPMTIKESYDIAGLATCWGAPEYKTNIAACDANAVAKLKAAGAHFLGKTNVPTMLDDIQAYNPIYGTTNNPWNLTRTSGGSSGGSAAALAAGLTGLEVGSDIGGSIRTPAHFCGVFGHKPTWGIVSPEGHGLRQPAPMLDLAVCGPLARSADDIELALSIIQGPGTLEARGWKLDLPAPPHQRLSDFRVAIWPNDSYAPVSTEIADRLSQLGEVLAKLGCTVSDSARPNIDPKQIHVDYQNLLHSQMAAAASPQRYERNQQYAARYDLDDMSPQAVMSRAMVLNHADWLRADARRHATRYVWREFFADWDILICPQSATTAFPHDHRKYSDRTIDVDGDSQWYFQQIFWSGLITTPLLPSTVVPTGPSAGGLPIGVQCVGDAYQDRTCIEFAKLLSQETGGFTPPPI